MASVDFTKSSSFNLLSTASSFKGGTGRRYDVFVSFRGQDIRKSFADHFFAALKRNGVYAFRDNKNLARGKVIGPDLVKAIEESSVSIIVFSERYADSSWCLDELVKIMECHREFGQIVFPVFYGVDPSDVRKLKGKSFEEAFCRHEEVFKDNLEKVKRWRVAMSDAGHLSGFHLLDKLETDFIEEIVKETLSKLKHEPSSATVGMNHRLEELNQHIGLGYDDVRFVGIHGMGGIGKTTLAELFYDQMSNRFDGSCFLEDVRKNSEKEQVVSLQEKIISQIFKERSFQIRNVRDGMHMIKHRLQHLKVLIVIDDVDHIDQLTYLVGGRDWFGSGSRIVVTTRDEHVLSAHGIDNIYKVGFLDENEALQLLSLRAFKAEDPPADYVELCRHVLKYCDKLPLAIKVVGSFLNGRSKDEWNSALERMRRDLDKEVIDILRISYDGLTETEKNIFLDIAFFFRWERAYMVNEVLDTCGFQPKIGIKVLVERCLISVSDDGIFLMHDLLVEMAMEIVRSESLKEPGKRTRLQQGDEAANVLVNNMGAETIEGIVHDFPLENGIETTLNPKVFIRMKKLRVLVISRAKLPRGLAYLPNELRYLMWDFYPLKSLPTNFEPENIVLLQLKYSNIRQLWKRTKVLNKLLYLILDDCWRLTETPDFTCIPNVKFLSLERCSNLSKIHSSLGHLRKLTYLILSDCENLASIPDFISLESLEICNLSRCSKLKKFPNVMGEMKSLKVIDMYATAIKGFPFYNFRLMKNLQFLRCPGHKSISSTSHGFLSRFRSAYEEPVPFKLLSVSGLDFLTCLDLSFCNLGEGDIPNDLESLSSLLVLILSGNYFVNLPASINQLSSLSKLFLDDCKSLKSLSWLPPSITEVTVGNCTLLESSNFFPFNFLGLNCVNLVKNVGGSNLAFTIMKEYFHTSIFLTWSLSITFESYLRDEPLMVKEEPSYLEVLFPGSRIPDWFSIQSEGSSMTSEKQTDSSNVLLGYAISCVFSAQNRKNASSSADPNYDFLRLTVNDSFSWKLLKPLFDDDICKHIWLMFFPIKWLESYHLRECSQTTVMFTSDSYGVVVKQCALREVYEQDVKDFTEVMTLKLKLLRVS